MRTGRFRHAIAAAAWLVFGLIFFEKALILPLVLLGVTSGFLMEGPWPRAIGRCLVKYWKSWVLEVLILAVYAVVLTQSLHTSTAQPTVSGVGQTFSFTWGLLKNTFVPGALGGPWQWFPTEDAQYAASAPPGMLAWLALIVAARRHPRQHRAAPVCLACLGDPGRMARRRRRDPGRARPGRGPERRGARAADPVRLRRAPGPRHLPGPGVPATAGQPDIRRRPRSRPEPRSGRLAAAGLVGAFVIGSVWSVQDLQTTTSGLQTRLYIANARVAVAEAPAHTVIADSQVPTTIMIGAFGKYADTSRVIGPMEDAAAKARLRWTSSPHGTIDHLMVFGTDGRLRQAAIYGQTSAPPVAGRQCHPAARGRVVATFPVPADPHSTVLRIAYLADTAAGGADMTVRYGSSTQQLAIESGLHSAYLTIQGSAATVTISSPAIHGLCVGDVQAGIIVPSPTGLVIPAAY